MWRLPPALFLLTGAAAFSPVPVFESYTGIPLANCFRQPILLRISSTTPPTLLAIAEGRTLPVNWCSSTEYPDTPDFLIAARRSTDEGATWGELINITHGNLDFLTALYDESGGGVVHLMLQQGDAGVVETTSSDGGLTWTPTANVSIDGADAFATVIPGVGHGLEIRNEFCWVESCGATVGRLVMPFVCTLKGPVSNDTACSNCRTCLIISDDHGATWRVGAVSTQEGTREAALVQGDTAVFNSPEAVIFAQERNLGPTPGTRLQAFSLNSGSGFQYLMNTSLPDVVTGNWTGVVSGTARFGEVQSARAKGGCGWSARGSPPSSPLFLHPFPSPPSPP